MVYSVSLYHTTALTNTWHTKQENMHTNYLTCFQNSVDMLQDMIASQTADEHKDKKQKKGSLTSHTYRSTNVRTCFDTKGFCCLLSSLSLFLLRSRSFWSWDYFTSGNVNVCWLRDKFQHSCFLGLQFGEKSWSHETPARRDRLNFPQQGRAENFLNRNHPLHFTSPFKTGAFKF